MNEDDKTVKRDLIYTAKCKCGEHVRTFKIIGDQIKKDLNTKCENCSTRLKVQIEEIFYQTKNKNMQLFTGEGGLDSFNTEMELISCKTKEEVAKLYRKLRKDHFELKVKYRKAITPWYKKLYYWLKEKIEK